MGQWPHYAADEIAAVTALLESGKVNAWTGPDVSAFEAEFAAYTGARHAIALANGSLTLNLALQCLGLQPGDEVIVTPRSFVASASCVLLFGATPVFAEVDPDSQNITPASIEAAITPRTRGIIPVHLAGWPCDMPGIMELAAAHGLWVVEDCAQAHGARIGSRPVGTFGTFGSFSFCQDKIMSTGGEGGMLVTDDPDLWRQAWSFKDHGKDHAEVHRRDHPPGFRWLHDHPGTNYRMTGLSAAIGRRQLQKLDDWQAARAANAAALFDALGDHPLFRCPKPGPALTHGWYRAYAFVRPDRLAKGWTRDRIISSLTENGFRAFSGSCSEIYREKVFAATCGAMAPLPVARELGETSLAFLVDPSFCPDELGALGTALKEIGNQALAR
ncbi:DegT/DnrJ/EryC1/StrS family aminotransferase [Oceanomicrobium pacificus]|uniref:Aminotransferase n=1 Tax=Oceanomicrobium pacificus TaxID=2692916 RepID=A0A6B0TW33_9RHOB|nr:DegT/DnrJ/EryC1/StrS family aminotransferase [Oceanomicrobium pacificus]MXU65203.1 aminotransferase [Oceanomicrobium pacificus]